MAFKFEEDKVDTTLTENQRYLSQIERRISGLESTFKLGPSLLTQKQYDKEIKRLKAAQKDVKSKLSKAELKDYKIKTAGMSPEEQAAALKAAQKAMDKNVDKPSI